MALTIESPEAEELALRLARETGESVDDAVLHALRERIAHGSLTARQKSVAEILADIHARMDKLPILDSRTPEEIIGYNELGHFD